MRYTARVFETQPPTPHAGPRTPAPPPPQSPSELATRYISAPTVELAKTKLREELEQRYRVRSISVSPPMTGQRENSLTVYVYARPAA